MTTERGCETVAPARRSQHPIGHVPPMSLTQCVTNNTNPPLSPSLSPVLHLIPDPEGAGVPGGKGSAVVGGAELIRRQFLALFLKRFHHARRSRKGLIAQVMASDRTLSL